MENSFQKKSVKTIKTNTILIVCSLSLCMALSGCDWFFHSEDTYISTLNCYSDYENAISGTYGILAKNMSSKFFFYPNLNGDDMYNGLPHYTLFYKPYASCTGRTYTENFDSTWIKLYGVITSANNILVQYQKLENADENIKGIVGEAYLLRAYCYFRLAKVYGGAPIIDNIDVNYTVTLSSSEEVLEFAECDLLKAEELLSNNRSSSRVAGVTPHKGTAKALLAELYLYWAGYPVNDGSKYALAAQEAKEVIDSAEYYGFKLENDFANLWSKNGMYSNESVFTIYLQEENNLFKSRSFVTIYLDYDRTNYFSYFFDQLSYWGVETNSYNNYPKNYRRDITFLNNIYYYDNVWTSTRYSNEKIDLYIDTIKDEHTCMKLGYRKFFYDITENSDTTFEDRNIEIETTYYGLQRIYLFRYAQTLLTYAEAAARSGQLNDNAYNCVNQIRRRANKVDPYAASKYDLPTGLSADAFADSVVQERAWELAGETEGRWSDMIRLGLCNNCFFTIPEEDVILNPSLGR